MDRLTDGRALPHHDILNGLQAGAAQRRRVSAHAHAACACSADPFQDLLTCAPRLAKQKGRIARGTLVPAVELDIPRRSIPTETAIYVREARGLVLAQKDDAAIAWVGAFWPLASALRCWPRSRM